MDEPHFPAWKVYEVAAGRDRDAVKIMGARLPASDRAAVDAEVEAALDEAVRFALASPPPDPVDALDLPFAAALDRALQPQPGQLLTAVQEVHMAGR
jgi:hypothetical protein